MLWPHILFLDFDGTVHPLGCPEESMFSRLALLEDWLREQLDVDVVVTSAWREHYDLERMRSLFSEDLRARVVGVTPWLTPQEKVALDPYGHGLVPHERMAEIEKWLATAGRRPGWVVLDDDPELFPPGTPQLVLCNPRVGLTQRELDQVAGILMFDEMQSELLASVPEASADSWEQRVQRGELVRVGWTQDGTLVPPDDLAKAWGRTAVEVGQAADRGELFRLSIGGQLWYPAVFLRMGAEDVRHVNAAMGAGRPEGKLLFWLAEHGALGGKTPAAAVQEGRLARVVELARAWASEGEFGNTSADGT